MFIVLITLVSVLSIDSGKLTEFRSTAESSSHNMEIYSVTEDVLSTPGYHTQGSGGENWQYNADSVTRFGLATDYLTVKESKINALTTTGNSGFNYSQFRGLMDVDNQYHFTFTWMPIVETPKTYTKSESPLSIDEPQSSDTSYTNAENTVHYGNFQLEGENYWFLVTAHNGQYDTLRVSPDRDFRGERKLNSGDSFVIENYNFTVEKLQNRDRSPGSSVILSNELNSFGPSSEGVDQRVIKLNRFAVLDKPLTEDEPLRIEVLSW